MIKANELRIGNAILFEDDNLTCIVKGLDADGLGVTVYIPKTEEETWIELECFSAIPLTPEILEKCGFVKELGKIDIFSKDRLRLWFGVRGETLCYLIEENTTTGHYIRDIQHLHQLQNLYYALTGEELNVQL